MLFMIGTVILWLIIGALLLRFTIGSVIDVLKKGSAAPITSWIGFLVVLIIVAIFVWG